MRVAPSLAHAPLLPVAVAAIFGIIVDRVFEPPISFTVLVALAGFFIAALALRQQHRAASVAGVLIGIAGLFGLHHHLHRWDFAADDIGNQVTETPRLVKVRGRLVREPTVDPPHHDDLMSMPRQATTRSVVAVEAWLADADWRPASGRASLTIAGTIPHLRSDDRVEVLGWLSRIGPPDNPGEWDRASFMRDQRILASISVHKGDGVVRLEGNGVSFDQAIVGIRAASQRVLQAQLDPDTVGVAEALLLGEGASLDRAGWERYIRTGVVHVLAISGQHFVVLAFVFGWLGRLAGVRQRRLAIAIALLLTIYTFVTGARPPVVRAAVMVLTFALARIVRRQPSPTNSLALAALVVLLLNPTDLNDAGCLFSFLCVAVLIGGVSNWFRPKPVDPLEQLTDAARPLWLRLLRSFGKSVALAYAVTLTLGLAVLPLAAARYHLISFAGLVIGPPVILMTSIALVSGFLLIPVGLLVPFAAWPFAWATNNSLRLSDWIVARADQFPMACLWVGDIPVWWSIIFYLGLIAAITIPFFITRPATCLVAAFVWVSIGLGITAIPPSRDGLVVTFLAVGHGGCTVIETPDGRTLLYDAGALNGPEITRRVIAPFLWHRRISRIDEVLLSHADLDHFNGMPDLLDRFSVGKVSWTPSFAQKTAPGVRSVVAAFERHKIPTRILTAGDRLDAGDVIIDVLHPPPDGPAGAENSRSLTLVIRHAGHSIMLTGDLEKEGMSRLLSLPSAPVQVLMAPHHGSRAASPSELARWCQPKLVVSCQGPPHGAAQQTGDIYIAAGAAWWPTWPNGAISLTSRNGEFMAESFRKRERIRIGD